MAARIGSNQGALLGAPVVTHRTVRSVRAEPKRSVRVTAEANAEQAGRREALGMVAGLGALVAAQPAMAAYGDAANVFGKATNMSGFIPFSGDGFSLLIPAKWNPSGEREFPGTVFRYEDNGDSVNCALVTKSKTENAAISDYGSPSEFLNSISYYLGQQSYEGQTQSEGGFAANRVSTASVLDTSKVEKNGKAFYNYELFTRTADGDEGGRHVLLSSVVSGGNLYILKIQIGDKRWFKGAKNVATGLFNSFTVA